MWPELLGAVLIWVAVAGYATALSWATGKKRLAAVWWGVKVGTGVLAILAILVAGAFLINSN